MLPARPADGPEQNRIGLTGGGASRGRIGVAVRIERRPAKQRMLKIKLQAIERGDRLQHSLCRGNNFRPNAIAGNDQNSRTHRQPPE